MKMSNQRLPKFWEVKRKILMYFPSAKKGNDWEFYKGLKEILLSKFFQLFEFEFECLNFNQNDLVGLTSFIRVFTFLVTPFTQVEFSPRLNHVSLHADTSLLRLLMSSGSEYLLCPE